MPEGFEGQWLGAGSTLWGRELRSWLCCSASDFTSLCSQWAASGHPSPRVGLQVFMRMDVIPFQGAHQGGCAQQIQVTKITGRLWAKPAQGLRLLTTCWWRQKEHKLEHPWWQVSGRWAGLMKRGAGWTVMAGLPLWMLWAEGPEEQNCPVRWLSKAVQRRWELSGSKELVEPQERQECTAWKWEYWGESRHGGSVLFEGRMRWGYCLERPGWTGKPSGVLRNTDAEAVGWPFPVMWRISTALCSWNRPVVFMSISLWIKEKQTRDRHTHIFWEVLVWVHFGIILLPDLW